MREPRVEVAGGTVQQGPNVATGSVNTVEIQFGSVGVNQHHPCTRKESGKECHIQFGIVATIAGGFIGGGASSSFRKRHYKSINSVAYLPPCSQPPITFFDADLSVNDPKQDDPERDTTRASTRLLILVTE